MKNILTKFFARLYFVKDTDGQDIVEYALVVALIAFAATSSMRSVATGINTTFANIGTQISSTTS